MLLSAARGALAADLAAKMGRADLAVYPAPPPSFTPPAVWIVPTGQYLAPFTGCGYAVTVLLRFVTAVHETDGAYDDLDNLLEAAIPVVGRFLNVDIASRDLAGSTFMTADATVTYLVDLAP